MVDISQSEPLKFLQNNWQIIADECNALPREKPFIVTDGMTRQDVAMHLMINGPQWIKGWDGIGTWWNWGIALNYQYPLGDAGVPKTAALLKQVTGIKFASLSLFKGPTLLPTHIHPEMSDEELLTFHLGLDVPEYCFIGAEEYGFMIERNGKGIVFNGSLPHFSVNASSNDRLILYCEFSPENLGKLE